MKRIAWSSVIVALFLCLSSLSVRADQPKHAALSGSRWMLAQLAPDAAAKIEPALLKEFSGSASADQRPIRETSATFLVYLRDQADLSEAVQVRSLGARRATIVDALQAKAQASQAPLITLLDRQQQAQHVSSYTSYWIFNGLVVEGDLATVIALAQRPEVEAIRANRIHRLPDLPASASPQASAPAADTGVTWGLAKIRANQVWDAYGITGKGVVVANMDSGVDWTHPALQQAYRGYNASDPNASIHDHNWFDTTGTYPNAPGPNQPHLGNGADHGTHTMGTMVASKADGSQVYGVAPGAQWIAAKIFDNDGYTTDAWLHAGFQWIMAPTDLDGLNPDPSRAPDIVSNSWGNDDGSNTSFRRDLTAWNAAGIFSTWAAGNEGPGSGTVNAPGSFAGALAVGATDDDDDIAYFSSRGPAPWGEIKPEVSAPGVNIASTIAGGGIEDYWDGTSMATPHVAGLAALLYEASGHTLSITETQYVITSTVVDLGTAGEDNTFGYGRIDALNAVQSLIASGTLSGAITDATSGLAIADATVTITPQGEAGSITVTTGANGAYSLLLPEGTFDVTVSAYGYVSRSVNGVVIVAQTTTPLSLALTPQVSGAVRVTVTSAADGSPVQAIVLVQGTPVEEPTGVDGIVTLTLPVGSYNLSVMPVQTGLRGALLSGVAVNAGQTTAVAAQLAVAPTILLVDADAWFEDVALPYYAQSLSDLGLGYDLLAIADRYADVPSAQTLQGYDVVIWANSIGSPGYIGAWDVLGAFLDGGGALLLSGQDVAYWDVFDGKARDEFAAYVHASYVVDDAGAGTLLAAADGPWSGLTLVLDGPDSARNQVAPDEIMPSDALAVPIASYAGGGVAALAIETCDYRLLYAAFGLEGVGPRAARAEALQNALDWLMAPASDQTILATMQPESQAALLGGTVTADLTVYNRGQVAKDLTLLVTSPWPAALVDGQGQPVDSIALLAPCEERRLRLQVTVPATATIGSSAQTVVSLYPAGEPAAITSVTLTVSASNVWHDGGPLPTATYRGSAVVDDCRLILAGGFDPDDATSHVLAINASDGSGTDLADMPVATANAPAVLLGDEMYVLGGYDDDQVVAIATVQIYNTLTDSWRMGPAMPAPRSGAAAAVVNGDIYVFGGNAAGVTLDSAVVLRSGASQWQAIASLPTVLDFGQAVALDGFIYLAGGWPDLRQLLRYDPLTDSWSSRAPMLVGRQSFVLASEGHYLYAAGGGSGWDGLSDAERYDPVTDSWLRLPSLRQSARAGAVGGMLAGRLYVVGGSSGGGLAGVEYLDVCRPLSGSTLEVDRPIVQTGDLVTYTLVLQNPSAAPVPASWRLGVPVGTQAVEGSSQGGGVLDSVNQRWHWQGTLAAQSVQLFSMRARVNAGLALNTLITATAELTGAPCGGIVNLPSTSRVIEPSLGSSTKAVDLANAVAGSTLHYTIAVENSTPYDMAGVVVTDVLPNYLSLVPESLIGASWHEAARTLQWQGRLEPGAGPAEFAWRDASSGSHLALGDDDCAGPLELGFSFAFYGQTYEQIHVNSNGLVLFTACSSAFGNASIPSSAEPNGFVAPFWDDLNPGAGGAVYFDVQGAAPQRVAIITWQDVPRYGTSDAQTFQVLLMEGTNGIKCQYLDVQGTSGTGDSATVGIESADGTRGIAYLVDGLPSEHQLRDGLAILLDHDDTQWSSQHLISFAAQVDGVVPPGTTLVNRAEIYDGHQTHLRTATTALTSPQFHGSSLGASAKAVATGQSINLLLQVMNSGDAACSDVLAELTLPSGLRLVAGQTLPPGVTVEGSNLIRWQGALNAGQIGPVLSLAVEPEGSVPVNTRLTPTLVISAYGQVALTIPLEIKVNTVDLSTSRVVSGASGVRPGEAVNLVIDVRNTGNYTAAQASVRMVLPAALEMVDALLFGATYDPATREVAWQGALWPDGVHTIIMQALVAQGTPAGSSILVRAVIQDGYGTTIQRQTTVSTYAGDLQTSSMTLQPLAVGAGEAVTVTMRLVNSGSEPLMAVLTHLPPASLSVRPASLHASSGELLLEHGTLHWTDTVVPGTPVVLSFVADTAAEPASQIIPMVATLTDANNVTYHLQASLIVGAQRVYLPLLRR